MNRCAATLWVAFILSVILPPNARAGPVDVLLDRGIEPKEITAALLSAVDRRDMPAREGLVAALEFAHAQRKTTLEMLAKTAGQESDSTSRLYARAALREALASR